MGYKILSDDLTFANVNSDSPKVCFLHGWGTSGKDFSKIDPYFESITIDIPGFGKSVPFTISFSPKKYAEYLYKLIPDSVEIVVGHSFGGRIAAHLSQLKNYEKIVIIASPLIKIKNSKKSISFFNIFKFMNKLNLLSDNRLDSMRNKYGSEDYKNANNHLKDTLVMAVNDDLKGILPYIDTKVELVWGEEDLEVPLQVGLDSNDIIPNSELTIIPGGGHNELMRSSQIIIGVIKK